jgi:MerR family transcriptional regulator, light-induced transcriptional regulator
MSLDFCLVVVYFRLVELRHPIHLAAKRSGLTPHVIRAWERRYDAVSPGRTDSNRRLYSDAEIDRLQLLAALTQTGHRIGDIARLPTETLRERAAEAATESRVPAGPPRIFGSSDAIAHAIDAVGRMDAAALGAILDGCAVALGQRGFLERFVSPLARRIGELWAHGAFTAAHEHFASNELRDHLLRGSRVYSVSADAPLAIVTTPSGQLHELGAAIAAAAARDSGWRALYLGPNLPAADIAHAAVSNSARLVALSIVYPEDDFTLPSELALLRRLVPAEIAIVAGGAATHAYQDVLRIAGIPAMDSLGDFARHLAQARMLNGRKRS